MSEKGFTFIEILIAVFILALITLSIMALLPTAYKQITNGGRISIMNHLGHQKIDELKALGTGHADLTAGTHPAMASDYRKLEQSDPQFKGYSVVWKVTDDSPTTGVKTIVVEVGYMVYDTSGNSISNIFQLKEYYSTYLSS